MIENKALIEFHLAKFGWELEKDFLLPVNQLRLGDPDYELKLRIIKDKLDVAHCTFGEIGIDNDSLAEVRKKGAALCAKGIAVALLEQPQHSLNVVRMIMFGREMKIAGIGLSELSLDKERLIAVLPPGGMGWLDVSPSQIRECGQIIACLLD